MHPQTITIILSSKTPQKKTLYLDQRIINFHLHPIQSTDYIEPFEIPEQIAVSELPFDIASKFAELHSYSPGSPKFKLPISTNNYKEVVDPITFEVCQRYTNLQYIEEAQSILRLAKWLQFRELEKAIASAIAVNYYTGHEQKQIEEFINRNKLQDITSEQIQQIYEEHKDIFDYIEQKTKQDFLGETAQQFQPQPN